MVITIASTPYLGVKRELPIMLINRPIKKEYVVYFGFLDIAA